MRNAVLVMTVLLACAVGLQAGPMEDAKKLIEEKKYDEVDKALEKLLAQKDVPLDVLRLSLDAAVARGRVITAQQRITAILKLTQNKDLALVWQGAQIAEQAGDERLALARYLAYAKGQNEKDAKLEYALRFALNRGAYPEEYQKYVAVFGKSEVSWTLGAKLAQALFTSDEATQGLALCELLMQNASRPAQVTHVHWLLADAEVKGFLGADPEARYLRPLNLMVKYRPDNPVHLQNIFHERFWRWDKCPVVLRLDLLFKAQDMWKARFPWPLMEKFGAIREVADENKRLEFGRRYLSFEPIYKGDPDPNAWREYLQFLADAGPQVYCIEGKELLPGAEMAARFEQMAAKCGGDLNTMNHFIQHIPSGYLRDPAAQAAFLKKHSRLLMPDKAAWVPNLTKGENLDATVAELCKDKDAAWIAAFRGQLLPICGQLKNKDALGASAREWLALNPGSFDWRHLQAHFMNSDALSLDEKLAVLNDLLQKGGASAPLKGLVSELDKDKKNWGNQPSFRDFKKTVSENNNKGSDPLMSTHVVLHRLPWNQQNPGKSYYETAAAFLEEYKGPIPSGDPRQDALLGAICWRHFEAIWNNRGELERAAKLWTPRLSKGFCWEFIVRRLREHGATDSVYRLAKVYLEQLKDVPKTDPALWYSLAFATNPKADPKSLFAEHYDALGAENAITYLTRQGNLDAQTILDDLAKAAASPQFPFGNPNLVRDLARFVFERTNAQQKPPPAFTQTLWQKLVEQEDRSKAPDLAAEAWILGQFPRAERAAEHAELWKQYLALIQKRPPMQQVQALASIAGVLPREPDGQLKPGSRCHTLLKELKPRLDALSPAEWSQVTFYQDNAEDLVSMATRWPDGEAKQESLAMARRAADMLASATAGSSSSGAGGARFEGKGDPLLRLLHLASSEALAQQDWPALSRLTQLLAGHLSRTEHWENLARDVLTPLTQALKDKVAFEIGFIFLDQTMKRNKLDENISKTLVVAKAEMARAIPELLVQKGDPAFDLHAAARALALGGEARAWELTQPRLPLLKKLWIELDPQYVVWSVEQMRKQKMVKEALDMCFTILLRELELDAETAASVILVKGDCFAHMQNFQAARIEYEGLKNNKRYGKTDAGAKAKYRFINLMILTKDYARAEELLQMLVDSDNIETQAEAYFLYARMAFEQQQYEEARKYLTEVFKRRIDHVEGKLLEGELRLLVRGGLASTEVEAGTPELGTVAIPGMPLTLKLQDQNLAISQGGAAVRVLVTTSKGGDSERINLHAAPGTKDVFSATIPTALGAVQKGDMTLQVRGDDTVSYVIDPEYQKAHGISYAPKLLAVRYDPRMLASSGEILSEEEQEKREAARRQALAEAGGVAKAESVRFTGRDEKTVRPGSPIYVQITDLAQDLSDQPDTVKVTAKTTSGDVFENVPLQETGPHTGLFRGTIPTAVPLPRVAVSDAEEGKDPGTVIRPDNKTPWNSLADSVKPKWLEVDTMSSHLVKSATITLPDPKSVREVALLGMLADEYLELATHPPRAAISGSGLKAEYFNNRGLTGPPALTRVDPGVNYPGGQPAPKINASEFSVRWTGKVVPQFSEAYTFYTISDDGIKVWVDDKLIINNWSDHGPQENNGKADLQANKPADIKIEYYQGQGEGQLQFFWSSKSQKRAAIPQNRLLPATGVEAAPGGKIALRLTMSSGVSGGNPDADAIRGYLKTQPSTYVPVEQPVFDRADTPFRARSGWMTNRLSGVFCLKEPMEAEFKFLQKPSPNAWQTVYLFIDDKPVLAGPVTDKTIERTKKESLTAGCHRFELLVQDHFAESQVVVGFRKAGAGDFAPLPAEWFSAKEHPEIEAFQRRGRINPTPVGFVAVLNEPERLRKLKWVFEDFTGNTVSVSAVSITDSADAVVIPPKDAAAGGGPAKKSVLEVAPGEQIEISYASERRLRDETPVLTSMLNSSFFNATVSLANEVIKDDPEGNRRDITYQPARRCRPGDALMVIVRDNDADLTDERDTVQALVRTTSGEQLELKALETMPNDPADGERNRHTGFFLATLKVGDKTEKDTIAVKPGDMLTVSYLDKENTKPGIPFERTYSVEEAGKSQPEITVYRTRTEVVEDKSPEAQTKLDKLRMRGLSTEGLTVYKTRILARHPLATAPATGAAPATAPAAPAGAPIAVDVGAPVLLEVVYPRLALNSGSTLIAEATAESEVQAAAKENRKPKMLEIPLTITPVESLSASKGYPVQMERPFPRTAVEMLQEGCFSGVVRLQIGSPGDPVDDLVVVGLGEFESREEAAKGDNRYRIPTLLVSGSDTVHVKVKDQESGQYVAQDLKLLSDARLEVMDSAYTVMRDAIFLGETFALRLTDPDHDASDARDKVAIEVKAASGGAVKVELTETLPHSGIFTGSLKPHFKGDAGAGDAKPDGGALGVIFGDEIAFTFKDEMSLSGGAAGLAVEKKAKIHYGADGELAAFSKIFSDPEMAVKTRFLMAEALFEMAKEHRKLKQDEKAKEEIDKGKRILEEAMRDYPHTSLAGQGEFLLANLAQELGNLQEAVSRYSSVIAQWPDSEYAARSQFKMALCQEKMGNFDQASENFVRVIYLYPDSDLVADARIRLGNYYYKEKQYKVAARIFAQFQKNSPTHPLAAKTLFLAGQCHMKVEDWKSGIEAYSQVVTQYPDQKEVRAEAMYWLGECYTKANNFRDAYRTFKKITWDYPETKWAKIARGRLTEEVFVRIETEDGAGNNE